MGVYCRVKMHVVRIFHATCSVVTGAISTWTGAAISDGRVHVCILQIGSNVTRDLSHH